MYVGMLTHPFLKESLETVMDFAETASISALEIPAHPGSSHIDATKLNTTQVKAIKRALEERMLSISALCFYTVGWTDPKQAAKTQQTMLKVIDAAAALEVPTVCTLAGFAAPGMTKVQTIQKVLPKVFKPVLAHARKKKVNLALENWFETCLQGLDTFEAMFEAIPDANFGLNYDPSHLYHQECDYLVPVSMCKDRLFHTHAKDVLVNRALRAKVGVYGQGWWRYVVPGFGHIHWGEFVAHLRQNGYDGVLSIEHEDATQTREEGFVHGAWHLEQYC